MKQVLSEIERRATVAQKLWALVLCTAVPLVVTTGLYLGQSQKDISFSEREAIGVHYARAVWPVMVHHAAPSDAMSKRQSKKSAGFLRDAAASYDRDLNLAGLSSPLIRDLQQMAEASDNQQADRKTVVKKAESLLREVGDVSNLMLDPELDTIYLMDLTINRLPTVASALQDMIDAWDKATTNPGPEDEVNLVLALGGVEQAFNSVLESSDRAILALGDAPAADELRHNIQQLEFNQKSFKDVAHRVTAKLDFHDTSTNHMVVAMGLRNDALVAMRRTLAASDQTWRMAADTLANRLYERIEDLRQDQRSGLGLALLALSLAASLGWTVTRSIVGPQRALTEAMGKLAGSDLRIAVPFRNNTNELGATARAVEVFRAAMIERNMLEIDLESERDELEDRVLERTVELDRARRAMQEEKQTLDLALTAAHAGVLQIDRLSGEIWASDKLNDIAGEPITAGSMRGGILSCVHPDDLHLAETARTVAAEQGSSQTELRMLRPDGEIVWVRISLLTSFDKAIALILDITDAKKRDLALAQAQAAIQSEKLTLDLALTAARAGVWRIDGATRDIWFSNDAIAILGQAMSAEDFIDGVWTAVHPEDRDVARQLQYLALETGRADGEVRHIRPDGSVIWVRSTIAVAGNSLVGLILDITAAKHQEQALARAREQAEAANRAKSEFLATMSHEIRTPMNGVLAMGTALKRTPLRDDQREMVNVIGDSGELLLTILNDVLDLAKIESGKFSLKSIEFDLSDSLEAVCALYQDSASQKGLALRTDIEEAAHGVFKGDPVRIRQIIQNFTSNAIKFTEKGEVVVRARRTATGLRISVSDTGIGMNEEQCGRMFRKFEEADNTITRRFGGTGLGLSICKNIAEMMGGAVGVDSVEGRGSTFWFEAPLPYVRESTGRGDVEQDEAEIAYDLRILAADDNAVNRLVSKTLLEQAGLTADFVENGALAVQGAQIQTYDLILMDVHMPEMDGMAATRAIRKLNNSNATIPIIALTADVLPEHVARCREAGMTAHVAKPIKPDILYAAISAAFEAPEVDETKDGTAAA